MSTPERTLVEEKPVEEMPLGLHAVAAVDPERTALVDPQGHRTSFGELAETANRLANALRDNGVAAGDTVAALLHNDVEFFELALATGQIGVMLVPINVHLTAGEAGYIISDSGAKVLVAHRDLAEPLAEVQDLLPAHRFAVGGEVAGWADYRAWRDGGSARPPRDRLAGMLMGYTSGTTGRPKGVRRTLPPLAPEVMASLFAPLLAPLGVRPGHGVHLVCSPLYHTAPGNIALQLVQLGHCAVIRPKFDAEDILASIERYQVTSSHMVPTHVHRLLRLPAQVRARYDLSSLTNLLVAGAPFPPHAKEELLEWLGPVVWEYLGATEGLVSVATPQDALSHPGTVGKPIVGVRILDPEGRPLPAGEIGVIHFETSMRFEYLNDPDKTAAAYSTDGLATAGDLGRFDEDGYLYLADRRDDLIISGGVNIYPSEVEARLVAHPAVADVAVIGVSDPEWGQTVVAVVELMPGQAAGEDLAAELDRHARAGLAGQKCPRRYDFRAALPRTPTGKLLRRTLRQDLAS